MLFCLFSRKLTHLMHTIYTYVWTHWLKLSHPHAITGDREAIVKATTSIRLKETRFEIGNKCYCPILPWMKRTTYIGVNSGGSEKWPRAGVGRYLIIDQSAPWGLISQSSQLFDIKPLSALSFLHGFRMNSLTSTNKLVPIAKNIFVESFLSRRHWKFLH